MWRGNGFNALPYPDVSIQIMIIPSIASGLNKTDIRQRDVKHPVQFDPEWLETKGLNLETVLKGEKESYLLCAYLSYHHLLQICFCSILKTCKTCLTRGDTRTKEMSMCNQDAPVLQLCLQLEYLEISVMFVPFTIPYWIWMLKYQFHTLLDYRLVLSVCLMGNIEYSLCHAALRKYAWSSF